MGQALKATEVAFVAMSPQGSIKAMVGEEITMTANLTERLSSFKTAIFCF